MLRDGRVIATDKDFAVGPLFGLSDWLSCVGNDHPSARIRLLRPPRIANCANCKTA